ncbi:ester cyclase [Sorangium sp. So ce1128]
MSTHDLKSLYREYVETVWHKKNVDAAGDYFADDVVDHAAPPEQGPGLAGLKKTFAMFLEAFPDFRITIEDLIAEGDKLVARVSFTGTHRGAYHGIPATNRRVESGGTHIVRFVGKKVAEHWAHSDDLRTRQQLGLIPTPGQ